MYTPQGQDKDDTFVLVFGSKSVAVEFQCPDNGKKWEKKPRIVSLSPFEQRAQLKYEVAHWPR